MKKYIYRGDSILSFTHEGKDFQAFGEGPHSLPELAPPVQSAVGLLLLEEIGDKIINTQKTDKDGK